VALGMSVLALLLVARVRDVKPATEAGA